MIGTNFPVSDYYKNHILDAETISKKGAWWTAALLIEDLKSGKSIINIYKWQLTESGWKSRKRYTFKNNSEIDKIFEVISRFSKHIE